MASRHRGQQEHKAVCQECGHLRSGFTRKAYRAGSEAVMSDAESQIRGFIDRILRLKAEQDTIGDDIKDVYAEAKGVGFDKTVMGQLVSELRKKGKDAAKFEENSAILDLYREAYERASHAHTREGDASNSPAPHLSAVAGGRPSIPSSDADAGKNGDVGQALPEREAEPAKHIAVQSEQAATDFEPPAFLKRQFVLRPHCQKPDACAGYGAKHCRPCLIAAGQLEVA